MHENFSRHSSNERTVVLNEDSQARKEFENRAEEISKKYPEIDTQDVMLLFAENENVLIDKHNLLDKPDVLSNLYKSDIIKDEARWDYVEERIKNKNLEKEVITDPLTGLVNRRGFNSEIQQRAKNNIRESIEGNEIRPISLIAIDLDKFKQINDLAGHDKGDRVLKAVADLIKNEIRPNDLAVRQGGEEMSVLVDGDIKQAEALAERIRIGIKNIDPQTLEIKPEIRSEITASFGVAEYTPTTDEKSIDKMIEELQIKADNVLYEAKESGRNQVKIFTE